jgi:putative addiction module killer protein
MNKPVTPKTITFYADEAGREPFSVWLKSLRDSRDRRRVIARLFRLEQGHYGDVKSLGGGVHELRLFFGPGYRLYFGEDQGHIVVLLCAGDKNTQPNDIETAKAYWKLYQEDK